MMATAHWRMTMVFINWQFGEQSLTTSVLRWQMKGLGLRQGRQPLLKVQRTRSESPQRRRSIT